MIVLSLVVGALMLAGCATGTATATPTAVTAAASPSDAVTGIYKSVLPGASSPGIDCTLYLNYDGTLRQIYDYLNEAAPLVQVGTWEAAEDGTVTLTITGDEEKAYDEPSIDTLKYEEGVLTQVRDEATPGALLQTWYEFGALATGNLEMPYDAEMAAKRMESNLAEHYKAFLRSASCCGRDIDLSLQIDGIAVKKTDYLNGEAAIEEVGTWESTGTDSLTVTLNSQQERVYDTPTVTDYTVVDGTLVDSDGVVLRSIYGYVMYVISQVSGETASVVDVDAGALTEPVLSEAEYDLPDLGLIQLQAGQYERQYGSGATQVNRAHYQAAGFGDLDGDGADDAAVVVATETGGSGSFYYLIAMLNRHGTPQQAAQTLLGDRLRLEYVGVEEGTIVVRMKVAGPDDPMCCPSQEATQVYQLQNGALEMIEGEETGTATAG